MGLYGNHQLTGIERTFGPDELIVTKTDLSGKITYANRTFQKFAGFSERECLGTQHNLVRHPLMPRAVFKFMWETLAQGDEVFAYVLNRSKNGDEYWVFAHVTPSRDGSGNIIGYHSNRRLPNRQVINDHIIPLYARLLETEHAVPDPKEGMATALQSVVDLLVGKRMGFNQMMFSLGT